MASRKKITRKPAKADFDDMESVQAEMARVLDFPIEDVDIKEATNYSGFIRDTIYEINVGSKEYYVVRDSDVERELALAIVKQDLENEPEVFNQSFIEGHIDDDKLRDALMSDLEESLYESLKEDADLRPEQFIKDNDLEWPEPSDKTLREFAEADTENAEDAEAKYRELLAMGDAEDRWITIGEEPSVPDSDVVAVAESEAKARLKHPMDYMEEIYGKEDAAKQAIAIVGIDINAAAEEAVSSDGPAHFLSSYDGNTEETPSGLVWWRSN